MTDPSAPPTREEAMAAIAELERTVEVATSWTPDLPANVHISAVILTLAHAGAAVMFAGEETVARVAKAIAAEEEAVRVLRFSQWEERAREAGEAPSRVLARAALAALSTPLQP